MGGAVDAYCVVFRDGTLTCMARVRGNDAANITASDISSATYSVYLLDDQDADSRTATQHADTPLTVASVIFDTLQTDDRWTVDSTGYNFRHLIDISSSEAFTIAGRWYLVEVKLVPVSGQMIIVRFRCNTI